MAPKESHVSYINRKGYHSVLLQGVCDHQKLFTNVYAGEAGSIHDYTYTEDLTYITTFKMTTLYFMMITILLVI